MKLQNLIIIFLIIIIPIILIFTYYLNLETKTITIQTDYDEKLIEATKEAIEAFEINTTEWNSEYNTLSNLKRRDLMASINVFVSSLSSKLGIGGTAKENILNYIPAIVYIMYDGYYIYSPTYVPVSVTQDGIQVFYYKDLDLPNDENQGCYTAATKRIGGYSVSGEPIYECDSGKIGKYNNATTDPTKAKKIYKHVLKTFIPFSTMSESGYTINYTLGDFVRIYGVSGESGEGESREGEIDSDNSDSINYTNSISSVNIGDNITTEILSERIPIKNKDTGEIETKECQYIYNSDTNKRYYDESTNRFFFMDGEYNKILLPEVDANSISAEFKKVLIRENSRDTEYLELYQLLNPVKNGDDPYTHKWYKYIENDKRYEEYPDEIRNIEINEDGSAINYAIETACFNAWLKEKGIDGDSIISQKEQTIINNINLNLDLAIANYSANSEIDYTLPELTETDWEQALSNISMITFFQGMKTGLKTYNNYCIVTSYENNEFVDEDSLYYMEDESIYYHRYGCSSKENNIKCAYLNTEFKMKNYTNAAGKTVYYYKHAEYRDSTPTYGIRGCFNCIVNRNNMELSPTTNWEKIHNTAVAREKYIQMCRTRLTETNAKE